MTSNPEAPPAAPAEASAPSGTFTRTLVKVMTVQVVTLILLWLIQARYAG